MKFSKKLFGKAAAIIALAAVISIGIAGCSTASGGNRAGIEGSAPLGMDNAVVSGVLENGISYYVVENAEPENRIFLRLVVKAGSINEDDGQRGIAHFVEHLAFNGSEHFAENELIDYFESIGMSFGPEVNAYTSFEETVYMLEIPADDPEMLAQSMLVLSDWASALTFDPVQLDKERNVIVEEWRLGRGVWGRIQDKQIPFLLEGSRYAERLPIGDMDTIRTITRDRVIDFYDTWYRPELMSVVVIGDEAPEVIIESIERFLGSIPASGASEAERYSVPSRKKPAVLVIRDPELTYTTLQISELFPYEKQEYSGDIREQIIRQMAYSVFNSRLSEKTVSADPVMLSAGGGYQHFTSGTTLSLLSLIPAPGRFEEALQELLTELLRIEKFGIAEVELYRAQEEAINSIRQTWLNRNKQNSASIASSLVNSVLYDEPKVSIDDQFQLWQEFIPGITADDITKEIQGWFTGRGKMLMVTAPENAPDIPDDAALLNLWQKWKPRKLTPYEDSSSGRPLFDPADLEGIGGGEVVSESTLTEDGIIEWNLSNGARVLALPTAWKTDEILFYALSNGGTSLVSDSDYPSSIASADYLTLSGLNGFSLVELQRMLAGKTISASAWISEEWEGLSGSSSTQDLETLFQLMFLNFMKPSFTDEGWNSLILQYMTLAESRANSPEQNFSDLVAELLYGDNIRRKNLSMEIIAEMKQDVSEDIYRGRFADAGDFTFVFVGSFDTDELKELVERYIAVLPSAGRREESRYVGSGFPQGITEGSVRAGIDPKSRVFMAFGGEISIPDALEYERFAALISLMNIRFREVIREDMDGTYNVSVYGDFSRFPEQRFFTAIEFGCEPGREEELSNMILSEIASFRSAPVDGSYITKLSENFRRTQEEGLKNNQYWLSKIVDFTILGKSLDTISDTDAVLALFTPQSLQAAAEKYLSTDNYVRAYLMPAER